MEDNECPICFRTYGEQSDGSFLCKDGKVNSDDAENCQHYCCVDCIQTMYENSRKSFILKESCSCVHCPLCREDWTSWILNHYDDTYL